MAKHRKNKRGFKTPKEKILGCRDWCAPLYGGYYFSERKGRIIRYYGRGHKWVRTHFNRQLRREVKQMIKNEEYELIPDRKGDMWCWD